MSKNTIDKDGKNWEISFGFYPGFLIGFRTYEEYDKTVHVFYIPFVDVAIILDK